jgi:putative DNA methylase
MSEPYRKKLIEVALPLEAINDASRREKSPFTRRHPRALHVWWARRPLVACRAVIFASIVDDPSSRPDVFPSLEDQEDERQRLFRLIESLLVWENSDNETVLEAARAEIRDALSRDEAPPILFDPFSGGGSIPLEAERLGLSVVASDLNPVAALITKALVEIPPTFLGADPVNPDSGLRIGHQSKNASGLASDVRYYGEWIREQAAAKLGQLYPEATLPGGGRAHIAAWIWARTVKSPDPVFSHADVPLVSSFLLSSKRGREAFVEPVVENDTYRFVVRTGAPPDLEAARRGTRAGKAKDFLCLLSGAPIPRAYIREEGKAGRLGVRLMALVVDQDGRRGFVSPSADAEIVELSDAEMELVDEASGTFLSGSTPTRAMITGGVCSAYGLSTWGKLFTARQLIALITFSDLAAVVREKVVADGGSDAYADAIATYLALAVARFADFSNAITSWDAGNTNLRQLFSRQAIPMAWDFVETNPLDGIVDIVDAAGWAATALEGVAPAAGVVGKVEQLDAKHVRNDDRPTIACTDPPYYDNIGYAELSDFFYPWIRRALKGVYPDLFSTLLTPKTEELVVAPHRLGGNHDAAKRFFESGLKEAFSRMRESQHPDYPMTLFYAFKQAESSRRDGTIASTGWETMLSGLLDSGFMVTGTWPMRTEQQQRAVASGTNALASSVVLVCRPRPADAPVTTRRDVVSSLRTELPEALRKLQYGNVAPVDLAQAAIGPGMAVFSRYARVLEADGSPMSVRTALGLINQTLDEIMTEQEGDFDPDSRFAIAWFEQRGVEEGAFGEANVLAQAKNTSVNGLEAAGVLVARGGKVRLLLRTELSDNWDPALDTRLTVWEVTQHLVKRLADGGEDSAAHLLRRVGGLGQAARELAYRLYTICERKGWAQEALGYNSLVVAWPEIARLAAEQPATSAQQTLGV